ncbi:MAG: efflux RND transporter periplasmic adaptor subunit [Bacillota bacterium]
MKKKIIILLVILLLVGGVIYRGLREEEDDEEGVFQVETQTLATDDIVEKVEAEGNIVINKEKEISSNLSGTVNEVYVEEGEKVGEGDPLFKLDYDNVSDYFDVYYLVDQNEDNFAEKLLEKQIKWEENELAELELSLEQQQLSLENEQIQMEDRITSLENEIEDLEKDLKDAKEELEEGKVMHARNGITQNELESKEDIYENNKLQLSRKENELSGLLEEEKPNAIARAQNQVVDAEQNLVSQKMALENKENKLERVLEDLTVTSKKEGVLLDYNVAKGDHVTSENSVGRIVSLEELIAEVQVDEIDINSVEVGQQVELTSDSFDSELSGEVNFIAPEGDMSGSITEYKTEITLNDAGKVIKPGMFVDAEIVTAQTEDVILAPQTTVQEEEGEEFVFIYNDDRAEKREVETGKSDLEQVEISNVEEGEEIITGPFDKLQDLEDGQQVRR